MAKEEALLQEPGKKAQASEMSDNSPDAELILRVLKNFRIIFKSAQQHSRWVESQCGASGAQIWALSELAAHPGWRVTELANAMSLHQSTTSNLLDKLDKKGLIRRERDNEDQRAFRLFLTKEGEELFQRAPKPGMSLLPNALAHLPLNVLQDLDRAISQLTDQLEMKDEDAALQPLNWI